MGRMLIATVCLLGPLVSYAAVVEYSWRVEQDDRDVWYSDRCEHARCELLSGSGGSTSLLRVSPELRGVRAGLDGAFVPGARGVRHGCASATTARRDVMSR